MEKYVDVLSAQLRAFTDEATARQRAIYIAATKFTILEMARKYHVLYGISKDNNHLGHINIDPASISQEQEFDI